MIIAGAILLFLILVAAGSFFYGWIIMLLLGIIHSYAHSWPHPGFWISVGIGLVLSFATNILRSTVSHTEHKS